MKNISVISKLQDQTDASGLISHHDQVKQYFSGEYGKRENLLHFARGLCYSTKELGDFQKQGKKPINIQFQKEAMRAYMGALIQNPPKITFTPVEPSDQAIVDPLKHRLAWELNVLETTKKDRQSMKDSWATGVAYQEIYTYVQEGQKKPTIGLNNENVLAIYWDPNSKDLGRRDDAQFVDRDKFISLEDLENHFEELAEAGEFESLKNVDSDSYEQTTQYADRSHEREDQRNGLFKITERFYRVTKKEHFAKNR